MYITHVQVIGPFIKIFGQMNKEMVINVERSILHLNQYIVQQGPPNIIQLAPGLICLANSTDGKLYRARIQMIKNDGNVIVNLIDYGNEIDISINELRLLNIPNEHSEFLKNVNPQTNDYILSRVFGNWEPHHLHLIRQDLLDKTVFVAIDAVIEPVTLISIQINKIDYSTLLIQRNVGKLISLLQQKKIIATLSISMQHNQLQQQQLLQQQQQQQHSLQQIQQQQQPQQPNLYHPQQSRMLAKSNQLYNSNNNNNNNNESETSSYLGKNFGRGLQPGRPLHSVNSINDRSKQLILNHLSTNDRTTQQLQQSQQYYQHQFQQQKQLSQNMTNQQPPPANNFALQSKFNNTGENYNTLNSNNKPSINNGNSDNNRMDTKNTPIFTSATLPIGSMHDVFCSYIEDGPNLFSIQLKSMENDLDRMMAKIGNIELHNLKTKPSVGMACIARYSEDKQLYRAVIMSIMPTVCQVAYIDYGNAEKVIYNDIYEIPEEFLKHNIFAIRFTLSGYKNLQPMTHLLKTYFESLVLDQCLQLKVMPSDGPLFVQYCELYCNKQSVYELLLVKQNEFSTYQSTYEGLKNDTIVVIRYVESPKKFFIQEKRNLPEYEKMMDQLMIYWNSAPTLDVAHVRNGKAAICNHDNECYRVQIVTINNSEKVSVQFVDFGNIEEVSARTLKAINGDFLQLPKQAIECCLIGFETFNSTSDSPRVQLELFAESGDGGRRSFRLEIIGSPKNNVYLVNLHCDETNPKFNLQRRMFALCMPHKGRVYMGNSNNQSNYANDSEFNNNNNNNKTYELEQQSKNVVDVPVNDNKTTNNWNSHNNEDQILSNNDNWDDSSYTKSAAAAAATTTKPIYKSNDRYENRINDRYENRINDRYENRSNDRYENRPIDRYENKTNDRYENKTNDRYDNKSNRPIEKSKYSNNDYKPKNNTQEFDDEPSDRYDQGYDRNKPRTFTNNNNNNMINNNYNKKYDDQKSNTKDYANNNSYDNRTRSSDTSGKFSSSSRKSDNDYSANRTNDNDWDDEDSNNFSSNNINTTPPITSTTTSNNITKGAADDFVPFSTKFSIQNIVCNKKVPILINWWIAPHEFYVQRQCDRNDFEMMMKRLQTFYNNRSSTNNIPQIGASCIVKYAKDDTFYRSTIFDYNVKLKKYKIHFTDVGHKSICTINDIYDIERQFTELPQLAIKCCLPNIIANHSLNDITNYIDRYLLNDSNKIIYCDFQTFNSKASTFTVHLYIDERNLCDALIDDGYITLLPDDLQLHQLVNQNVLMTIIEIFDLSCFRVTINDCQIVFMCSYIDLKLMKEQPDKNDEFKQKYVGKCVPAKINSVTNFNVLIVTPLVQLFGYNQYSYICDQPLLTDTSICNVSHIENVNKCYIQNVEYAKTLPNLLTELYEYCEKSESSINNKNELKSDMYYAVKSPSDGNWYRATINKLLNDNEIEVFYIDYGNTEFVTLADIQELNMEQFSCYHAFATKAYLPIKRKGNIEIESVINEMKKLTENYDLTIKVLEYYNNKHWIVGIESQNTSLIDVLEQQQFIEKLQSKDELKCEIDNDDCKTTIFCETTSNVQSSAVSVPTATTNNITTAGEPSSMTTTTATTIPPLPKSINKRDKSNRQLAHITHADSPDCFYLLLDSDQLAVRKLHENIQIIAPQLPLLKDFIVNTYCIAKYGIDNEWYRAIIIDSDGKITSIRILEYGKTYTITDNALIKSMNESFKDIPPYATLCALPLQTKNGKDWSDGACKLIQRLQSEPIEFEYINKNRMKSYVKLFAKKNDAIKEDVVVIVDDDDDDDDSNERDIIREFIDLDLADKIEMIKSGEKCFISHINDLSDFYIQLDSDVTRLELLQSYIADDITKFVPLTTYNINHICIAKYEDGSWYRAKILSNSGNMDNDNNNSSSIEVFFIDYGNKTYTNELRSLPVEIAEIPYLSKNCKLQLPNTIEYWSDAAESKFQTLSEMGNTIFTVNFIAPDKQMIVDLLMDGNDDEKTVASSINVGELLSELCLRKINYADADEILRMMELNDKGQLTNGGVIGISDESYDGVIGIDDDMTNDSSPDKIITDSIGIVDKDYKLQKAFVTHTTSPDNFYIQLDCNSIAIENMIELLSCAGDFPKAIDVQENSIYAAIFLEDSAYYRAEILSNSNQGYDVLFIDYGNKAYSTDIRELPDNIVNIKRLAIQCQLELPKEYKWNAEATMKFCELVDTASSFNIQIIDSKHRPCIIRMHLNDFNINEDLLKLATKVSDAEIRNSETNELLNFEECLRDDECIEKLIKSIFDKVHLKANVECDAANNIGPSTERPNKSMKAINEIINRQNKEIAQDMLQEVLQKVDDYENMNHIMSTVNKTIERIENEISSSLSTTDAAASANIATLTATTADQSSLSSSAIATSSHINNLLNNFQNKSKNEIIIRDVLGNIFQNAIEHIDKQNRTIANDAIEEIFHAAFDEYSRILQHKPKQQNNVEFWSTLPNLELESKKGFRSSTSDINNMMIPLETTTSSKSCDLLASNNRTTTKTTTTTKTSTLLSALPSKLTKSDEIKTKSHESLLSLKK